MNDRDARGTEQSRYRYFIDSGLYQLGLAASMYVVGFAFDAFVPTVAAGVMMALFGSGWTEYHLEVHNDE